MKNILLVGLPRSGTTWVAKIVDSHPDVVYRHEPDTEFRMDLPLIIESGNNLYDKYIANYVKGLIKRKGARVCGKLPFFSKNYFNVLTGFLFRFSVLLAKILSRYRVSLNIIEIIDYKNKDITLLWKSIESAGRVGAILQAIPELKLIYLIRSPYGQIASVLEGEKKSQFTDTNSSSEDYGFFEQLLNTNLAKKKQLSIESIRLMSQIEKLALKWLLHNEHALEQIQKFPERSCVIRYEDVCMDTNKQVQKIFDFLGLKIDSQTRQFLTNKQDDANYYSVFKTSINSMDKWKKRLSIDEVSAIDKIIEGTVSFSFYEL